MRLRFAHTLVTASIVTASFAPATTAHAADSPAAEALFLEAKALTDKQQYAEACPKFDASLKLDRTLGTMMNLADCEEKIGTIASAWAHWGEAVELARKDNDKRATFAAGRRDALMSRLPRLRLDAKARAGIDVYRDDSLIEAGAYGIALPIDPGPHVVSVRRASEVLKKDTVTTSEGAVAIVALDLAAIEKSAPPPRVADTLAPQNGNGQRTAGYVIGGVGVATVIVAAVLEGVAIHQKSVADQPDSCVKSFCTPTGLTALDNARTFANAGQWIGIAGLVVTAIGVTTLLTAPSKSAPASPAPVTGSADPRSLAKPRWGDGAARGPIETKSRPAHAFGLAPWAGPTGGGLSLWGAM